MKLVLGGLLSMAVACAPLPPAEGSEEAVPVHGSSGRSCDASRVQSLIGREANSALGAEALRLSGAVALRWISPDSAVTMDFREDRLNVEIDSANRVTRVRCG